MERATRRQFLRGAAGASLLLPHLPSLSRTAEAQAAAPKKRLVVVYVPQQEADGYLPNKDAAGALSVDASHYVQPLEPFLGKALWVYNSTGGANHWASTELLTGQYFGYDGGPHRGPSIDQVIAKRQGNLTLLPSLEVSARPVDGATPSGLARTENNLAVPYIQRPRQAFERVFGAVGGTAPADPARQRQLRKSMLDGLMQDYQRTNGQLAPSDRRLLDEHVTLLRQLEQRLQLQDTAPIACDKGTAPAQMEGRLMAEMPARVRDHSDVIVRALACDATRIVTFMLDRGGGAGMPPYPFIPGSVDDFHQVAHGAVPNAAAQHFAVRRWQMEQFAHLLKGLDSIREGSRTLLDNTMVLWICELGYTPFRRVADGHSRATTSSIIVGSAGGYFKTGRIVDVQKSSYHNLLLTVGHAMGLQDLTAFGQKGNKVMSELRG